MGHWLTAILYALLFSWLPPEQAWRALFLLGLVPAIFVIFVRRLVRTGGLPPGGDASGRGTVALLRDFRPRHALDHRARLVVDHRRAGRYAITSWLPTFLKNERGLSVLGTGGYLAMVIVGSYVGYVVSAYLSDLLGRKKNFILFAVGSFVIVLLYTQMPVSDGVMLWLGFPLGFFASGIFSGMGAFLTELFPNTYPRFGAGLLPTSAKSLRRCSRC